MDEWRSEYVDTEYLEDVENADLEQLSGELSSTIDRNEHSSEDPLQSENQQNSHTRHATEASTYEKELEPSASGSGTGGENSHVPEDANQQDETLNPEFDLSGIADNENEPDTAEESLKDCLFFFKALFYRWLYRNQLRPRELCQRNIGANSIPELLKLLWSVSKKHIHRQVIFNGEEPHWSDTVEPNEEDISNFVTLQDPSKRKTYLVTSLTPRVVTTWRGKCIKVHVYVYSTSLETNSQHQSVLRTLISPRNPDRAGAHSTRDDAMLAEELREGHQDLEGHRSSWLL